MPGVSAAQYKEILKYHLKPGKFDVCLTSYEGVNICKSSLLKFKWKYVIIDEAHRIKNEESLLSTVNYIIIKNKILKFFKSRISEKSRQTINYF